MSVESTYEIVVGLEVHAQLQTRSKLFCGDSIAYGAEPNSQVSPITLGHPGTLPKMNRKAIEFAVKMGLACQSEIERHNYFARKNYFYPDLPKGYQISQHTTPICKNGIITIHTGQGEKHIRLNRIHLEEDAGKSLHDIDPDNTSIDFNRAGTPLIEIVTEPDIRSAEEGFACLSEIRKLVRYLDICDGNMEEGSLRCDANISVRKKGDSKLGTKVEVKNLNSIRHVKRAIEFEAARLVGILEKGEKVVQQTRSFDASNGTTFAIRDKEDADDYRYFADPDLTPFQLDEDFIDTIRQSIPALQPERIRNYVAKFDLSEYDARVLTEEKDFSDYFESMVVSGKLRPKSAANWLAGPVKSWMNDNSKPIADFPLSPQQMARLAELVENGKVSFSIASSRLFNILVQDPGKDPEAVAIENRLVQQSDSSVLEPVIDSVLEKHAAKVAEYKKGKKGLLALFVGEVMKQSKGQADPKLTNEILLKKLNS
jgi:aspartyl-tRNA(Asn)/glutamyl-tRNA(Gln) amidotransferase subunit B